MESKPIALVIEDDADLNEIFSSAMGKAGYQVKSVLDGTTAQQILAEITPAIVTLDLHIPGISGEAVLKYIRTDTKFKDVRVIVATADATFAETLHYKPDLVLLKPISFSQLSELASRYGLEQNSSETKT